MADILGTNVASGVVPFTTEDQYATHYSKYGNGGWREVATIEERDLIPAARRSVGMAVLVNEIGRLFVLRGGINNSNWIEFTSKSESYVHKQEASSTLWTVNHNLGKFPSVTVIDSAGSMVIGEIKYLNANSLTIEFSSQFSGTAYLN